MTAPIESPCRLVCRLGPDLVCDGCGRTIGEIAGWLELTPEARRSVMERVRDWRLRELTNPDELRR